MNFQNIPRSNKTIKRIFVPKHDAFACFDYEQIEYRILAYYLAEAVEDTSMAEAFRSGMDAHEATARLVLGRDVENDVDRQIGKTLNFSIAYAGGVPTVLRQMAKAGIECDRAQAKTWINELHARMPGIKQLNTEIADEVARKKYIFDLFNRRYHPDPNIPYRDAVRKLLNALIQGCAAGLARRALVRISKGLEADGFQSHMVNFVHDEIMLDAIDDELDVLRNQVPIWMGNDTLEAVVPITASMEVSHTSWADKEPYV